MKRQAAPSLKFLFFQETLLDLNSWCLTTCFSLLWGFLGSSVVNNLPANVGDVGLIPGSGRSPRRGNDNPPQYSCKENSGDRGSWQAIVHGGHNELPTTEHAPPLPFCTLIPSSVLKSPIKSESMKP